MDLQKGKVYICDNGSRTYYMPIHSQGEGSQIDFVLFEYLNKFGRGSVWKHTAMDAHFFANLLPAPFAMQILYGNKP